MHRFAAMASLVLTSTLGIAQESPTPPPAPAAQADAAETPPEPERHAVELLRREAGRVMSQMPSGGARRFLIATTFLPVVDPRTIHWDKADRRALTPDEFAALPEGDKAPFETRTLDDKFYYYTRFGTPLAYARPIEILSAQTPDQPNPFANKRLFDFGYGTIGHLRLLASLGADVHGVEVDPVLRALYSAPEDTGIVEAAPIAPDTVEGKLTLHHGSWPGDATLTKAVGVGFDFFISKNVLKRGYIHPAQEVDKRLLVDLGVDDDTYVKALAALMKPGGLVLIYNLSPAQKPDAYIPWADGRCPFDRDLLEKTGFEVLAYDADDSEAARKMGQAFEWDQGEKPMDLTNDLFATYTLLRRR